MKTENNNIIIPKWMINKLHLTGTELLSFAEIFGAKNNSVDEQATLNSMFAELGISRSSFYRAREKLVEKGLIRYIESPDGTTVQVTDKTLALAESKDDEKPTAKKSRSEKDKTAVAAPATAPRKKAEAPMALSQDEPKEKSGNLTERKSPAKKPDSDASKSAEKLSAAVSRQRKEQTRPMLQDEPKEKTEGKSESLPKTVVDDKMYPQTLFDFAELAPEPQSEKR